MISMLWFIYEWLFNCINNYLSIYYEDDFFMMLSPYTTVWLFCRLKEQKELQEGLDLGKIFSNEGPPGTPLIV